MTWMIWGYPHLGTPPYILFGRIMGPLVISKEYTESKEDQEDHLNVGWWEV